MRKVVITGIVAAVLAACSSINCPVQNTVYTVYNLCKADGTTDTLRVDTLWVWSRRADVSDTLLLNSLYGSTATTFNLPISYTNPEDTLHFLLCDTLGNQLTSTLYVKKENYPHFESVDCQAAFFHRITDVRTEGNAIDSVVINNPSVTYDASKPHFLIYFTPRY